MRRAVDSPGEVEHDHAPRKVGSQKRIKPVLVPEVNGYERGEKYCEQNVKFLVMPVDKI